MWNVAYIFKKKKMLTVAPCWWAEARHARCLLSGWSPRGPFPAAAPLPAPRSGSPPTPPLSSAPACLLPLVEKAAVESLWRSARHHACHHGTFAFAMKWSRPGGCRETNLSAQQSATRHCRLGFSNGWAGFYFTCGFMVKMSVIEK